MFLHQIDEVLEVGLVIGGAIVPQDAGEALGVELGGDDGQGVVLISLDDALDGAGGHVEAGSQILDGLMVGGVGLELLAEQLIQHRAFLGVNIVADGAVHMDPTLLLQQILPQGAAHAHVDELAAAADAHDGLTALEEGLEQRLFKGGALGQGLDGIVQGLYS